MEGNQFNVPEISFTISQNFYSTDDSRARIRQVHLKNLHVEKQFNGIVLSGYDEDHRIEDVSVEGIFIHNGDDVTEYTGELPYKTLEFSDPVRMIQKQ